jgi:uncharacterized membrane protein affecting hemolysin expression
MNFDDIFAAAVIVVAVILCLVMVVAVVNILGVPSVAECVSF